MVLVPVSVGCDSSPKAIKVHKVSGQIYYDGKPAEGVQVFLLPTSAPIPPEIPSNPHGVTKADGSFTITTFTDGDGAAEGGYQILLSWPDTSDPNAEATTDRFLNWYDAAHTKLSIRVVEGDNVIPPIKIPAITKPADAVEGIPGRN